MKKILPIFFVFNLINCCLVHAQTNSTTAEQLQLLYNLQTALEKTNKQCIEKSQLAAKSSAVPIVMIVAGLFKLGCDAHIGKSINDMDWFKTVLGIHALIYVAFSGVYIFTAHLFQKLKNSCDEFKSMEDDIWQLRLSIIFDNDTLG